MMIDGEVLRTFHCRCNTGPSSAELRFIDVKKKIWTLFFLCSRLSLDVALYVAHCDGKNYGPLWRLLKTFVYSCRALMYSVLCFLFVCLC